jgi:methionyl-tRNA formyltransferase
VTRIVFMGTPAFAVPSLKQLIAAEVVVGVVTQPDRPAGRGKKLTESPVKILAQSAGIPVYQPESLKHVNSTSQLQQWKPDLIVVVAFGQILRPHVLKLAERGIMNVHASLLPRWRGASPIQHAILAGDSESGISLMQMDEGLDTGPVFVQEKIQIGAYETAASLHDRLSALGARMLGEYLKSILTDQLVATPQDDSLATYAPRIKKEHAAIDWSKPSYQVDRLIRAMMPWPGAFTRWQGTNLKVISAYPVENYSFGDSLPGDILSYDGSALVRTGEGGLRLEQVQLAGKQIMPIEDFLRGRPDFIGSRLVSPTKIPLL